MSAGFEPSGVITLLTDFGLRDPFVGILHGVLLREAPRAQRIDLTHAIPAQAVSVAAFYLQHAFHWFAPGSVHLCVVDPGVGSARAAIAVLSRGHVFVAPDNGLLSGVLTASSEVRRVETERLGLTPASRTFHGRDVFAPVAAWLASGQRRFDELGEPHQPQVLQLNEPKRRENGAVGQVRAVDHFGNLITDLPGTWLSDVQVHASLGEQRLRSVGTYAEALPGECVALRSSFETWEIAQRDGSAAAALGAGVGSVVELHAAGAQA